MNMNLLNFATPNIFAVVLVLILIGHSRHITIGGVKTDKPFFVLLLLTMLQAVLYALSYVFEFKNYFESRFFAITINNLIFINNLFFAFLAMLYFYKKLFSYNKSTKLKILLLALPLIVGEILSIINFFVPVFFSITRGDVLIYSRAKLYFIPVVIVILYLIVSIILSFKAKKFRPEYISTPIVIFWVPIIIAIIVELLIPNFSISMLTVAISLTFVYYNGQTQSSKLDFLSKLLSRTQLMNFIENELSKKNASYNLAGIIIDIDNFKKINDKFGHLGGDEAIALMGQIIQASLPKNAYGFRYAGDEFVIMLQFKKEEEIIQLISKLNQNAVDYCLKENALYNLKFSCGYSICKRQEDTIISFLTRIDAEMYKTKTINRYSKKEYLS